MTMMTTARTKRRKPKRSHLQRWRNRKGMRRNLHRSIYLHRREREWRKRRDKGHSAERQMNPEGQAVRPTVKVSNPFPSPTRVAASTSRCTCVGLKRKKRKKQRKPPE